VVIGCFLNAKALVNYLLKRRGDIALLCAGTEGDVSEEDVCYAGAICRELAASGLELTAPAQEAARLWRRAARRGLEKFLAQSRGGAPLVKLGLEGDIRFCAQRDIFSLVPRLVSRGAGRSKPHSAEDGASSRAAGGGAGSDSRNDDVMRDGFRFVPAQRSTR
jgi:2-phosphosulfolactate phosphatase